MTINFHSPADGEEKPRIVVVGVGGAGGNAVNNMIRSNLESVDFVITNTDAQAIRQSLCDQCIQLGRNTTQGLGAGARPEVGRAAAEEALGEILLELVGANMVFITAGMGGGTGTGAASVIARAAREAGILTVGVVTKPFDFEGAHRMRLAEAGIDELAECADTLIVIPNQNLLRMADRQTTFADAFKVADQVLYSGVRSVTDLIVMPGLINLDFADIRSIMTNMGKAMWGEGVGEGGRRARAAAEAAISNPLLDEVSMKGARSVLINITGGIDLTLLEVDKAAGRIRDEVDPEANIIFGSTLDQSLDGRVRVSVVATGCQATELHKPQFIGLEHMTGLGHAVGAFARKWAAKAAFQYKIAKPTKATQKNGAHPAAEAPDSTPAPEPYLAPRAPVSDEDRTHTATNAPESPPEPEPLLAARAPVSDEDGALLAFREPAGSGDKSGVNRETRGQASSSSRTESIGFGRKGKRLRSGAMAHDRAARSSKRTPRSALAESRPAD